MAYIKVRKQSDGSTLKRNPPLKNLEGGPRYKAFLRKMNLPESPLSREHSDSVTDRSCSTIPGRRFWRH